MEKLIKRVASKGNPFILEIKGNSLDDGPGIRSVVFFKGCPLDCIWCHNPESKKKDVEISFDAGTCINCNTCIDACHKGALSFQNQYFIDREVCNFCFNCEDVCPTTALRRVGSLMTIEEIVKAVIKDKPFYDTSNGGVTLSGGEPVLYMPFVSKLMQALKQKGVHVLISTCGLFNYKTFIELIYPHVDLIYFDIKIMDSDNHKNFCGLPNKIILENFRKLYREYRKGGVKILPRTPLIPDITDTKENLSAIVALYKAENVDKTQLMEYNPLWQDKNQKLGIIPVSNSKNKMSDWQPKDRLSACKKIFSGAGIIVE